MSGHFGTRNGPNGSTGSYSNLITEDLFKRLLHLEIQKAVRLQYCVSVICFTADVPAEAASAELSHQIAEAALRQLRRTDVATIRSPGSSVALLLIDADTRALHEILDRASDTARGAATQAVERLSLSAGASCYPETATSGPELLRQATDLMARARAEGGNRLYLPVS